MPSNISVLLLCSENSSHVNQVTEFLSDFYQLSLSNLLKNPDLHWLNPDNTEEFSAISIEQVRDMNAEMVMRPFQGVGELKQAVFVICKIDLASVPAQNALLKSLEEPPAHVQFVLTSSQPQRTLPTILSRVKVVESAFYHSSDQPKNMTSINLPELAGANYSALIEKAGSFKEKEEARSFLKELLITLHSDNILQPTSQRTKQIQETLIALDYLGKNVNTRLVLENLLFQFKTV